MIGLVAVSVGAAAAVAAVTIAPPEKAAMEKVVREYILEHPEIIPEAMERLQAKETAKAIAANRKLIETPYAGAWEGNPQGDVTLVEFFDYACGYCRASLPVIDRLLKEDPKLRIVYREMPVLGPDSLQAAHLSLNVAEKGNYAQFHRAFYAAGRPDAAARTKIAKQFATSAQETPSTRAEVATNMELQSALKISGTPSWVVGDQLLSGAVGYDALKAAIADARAKAKG